MVDLSVDLCGVTLDNPVIPASGTFGYGYEFSRFYDIRCLGSISLKAVTVEPRYGNPLPRIAETREGMLNAVGLQNPGLEQVLAEELPLLAKFYDKPVIANISGFSVEEYETLAAAFDEAEQVGFIEVNISCPNVHEGGMAFGQDPAEAAKVTAAVRKATKKPVIVKLSPNVTSVAEIARACEAEGADAISLINTLMGTRIDIRRRQFILANRTGGLSGPAVFPVALRMVREVYEAVDLPVVGMGGISRAEDVIEMMMAGAACVQVGAANLVTPTACYDIIRALPPLMESLGIEDIKEIIGAAG